MTAIDSMTTPSIEHLQDFILSQDRDGVERCLPQFNDHDLIQVLGWVKQDKSRWADQLVLMVVQAIGDHTGKHARNTMGYAFVYACDLAGVEEVAQWCDVLVDRGGRHFGFKQNGMVAAIIRNNMDTVRYLLDRFSWDDFDVLNVRTGIIESKSPAMFDFLITRAPDQETKFFILHQMCLYGHGFPLSDLAMVEAVMRHFDIKEVRQIRLDAEQDQRNNTSLWDDSEFHGIRRDFFELVEAFHTRSTISDELGNAGTTSQKSLKL